MYRYLQVLLAFLSLFQIVSSGCRGHHHHHAGSVQHRKTAITNVLVWDGHKFPRARSTVVIFDGLISNSNSVGAVIINGKGGYLIPGLIDSNVRLTDCAQLSELQKHGVTTALDMGTHPYGAVMKCGEHGVTDIQGSGAVGTVEGTEIGRMPGFPVDSLIPTPEAGKAFVASRIAEGVDYIKVFLDPLGPDDATIKAVCQAPPRFVPFELICVYRWSKKLMVQAYKSSLKLHLTICMLRLLELASILSPMPHSIKPWMVP